MTDKKEKLSVPRGTRDILPADWRMRDRFLDAARLALRNAGFERIQTPTFEDTSLFARGVGEGTDIVGKEMYTFSDKSDRSLTLRPEGTAPVVRSYIAEGMSRMPQPIKLWYHSPMFRYEAPQKGRYREHYQIGVEILGVEGPLADAELIVLLHGLYTELGVPDVTLYLNSIGDAQCRPKYRELLVSFLNDHASELCEDCRARTQTNPLRTFDCKNEQCKAVMASAPTIDQHLCDDCSHHLTVLQESLDNAGVPYVMDPKLVRGLDYYTRTVFEFKCAKLGAQDTIGGGWRYDGLVETLGGPHTPAVGFGCGVDRVLIAMEEGGASAPERTVDVYVGPGDGAVSSAIGWSQELRKAGYAVETDLLGRSTNAQLKQASKLRAQYAVIASEDGIKIHAMHGREEFSTTGDTVVADVLNKLEAS